MFLQFIFNGIIMGSIYALVSLGFAVIYNTTRIFHIAYATVYMFCPYMILVFYNHAKLPFVLSFLIAIFLTIILSLTIEIFVYKPLSEKNVSMNIILISSLGVMIIITNIIALIFGNGTQIINTSLLSSLKFNNIILTIPQTIQFSVSVIALCIFFLFFKFSKFGLKTRAMRDDQTLCIVFGVNTYKLRLQLFIISAILASLAGGLVAYDVGISPYIGMPMLLNAVVALIIGGIGRFEAPIIGGFIIGVIQSLVIWKFSARWQDAVTFILLILFLLLRPQGLMGEKKRVI